MLVPRELSKGRFAVLALVLVAALTGVGYLVFTNFFKGSGAPQPAGSFMPLDFSVALPQPPLFQRNFFAQPSVRELQNYGSLPLTPPASLSGNPNLFGGAASSASGGEAGR